MPSSVVGPGHVVAGRYLIERWLGQGGMGSVYQAVQLSVRRTVALKRLVDEHLESASHVERFEREALALSRLSHQSTVRLFDFGTDERGCPFIVMEYLEGTDLAADLERHGPMRWDQALEVGVQILGSLAEAHASGVIHRDIKPANLFLCAGPRWPVLKLLDFGIAGGAAPTAGMRKLTLTGTVLGSAPYMSPEQAQGLTVGPAADLYSFGVVLFEMLTGRTPFEARTLTAQLLAKVLEAAPALRDVCPHLEAPAEVQALVASLLERDPARRPPSARATAERIEALLAAAPLAAPSRAAQRPKSSAPPQIPKTEPMLVPRTIDEGWAPPRADVPPPSTRARRAAGWGAVLIVTATAAGLWRALPFEPSPPEPPAALAALAALPGAISEALDEPSALALDAGVDADLEADARSPAESRERAAPSPEVPPALLELPLEAKAAASNSAWTNAATPAKRPSAVGHGREPRRRAPSRPAAPTPPAATPAPAPEPAAPVTPETLVLPGAVATADGASSAPSPLPEGPRPEEPPSVSPPSVAEPESAPLWTPPSDPRYWTIAAAQAAARQGEITPAQRNEIIAALRQRRLKARARAARAYREGRIGFDELLRRQYVIDRRIEGR